jgi:hypothetical protein
MFINKDAELRKRKKKRGRAVYIIWQVMSKVELGSRYSRSGVYIWVKGCMCTEYFTTKCYYLSFEGIRLEWIDVGI